jgi:hypothetical protein
MVDVTFVVSFHVSFLYRSSHVFYDVKTRSEALSGPRRRRRLDRPEHRPDPCSAQPSQALYAEPIIEMAPAVMLPGVCGSVSGYLLR